MVKFLLLLLVAFTSLANARGGEVGNGGDAVFCMHSTDNGLSGWYALDFFATDQIVPAKSWSDSTDRIAQALLSKSPEHGKSLLSFLDSYNKKKVLPPRSWRPSKWGLSDLPDEKLLERIPHNCYRIRDSQPAIVQAVIREKKSHGVVYNFDPNILGELAAKDSAQLSLILVHEWLWDYTDDVRELRFANSLLHSDWLLSASADDLSELFLVLRSGRADLTPKP